MLKISQKSWWEKRDNLKNKPSLSYKNILVIEWVMEQHDLNLGKAIERLIEDNNGLYDKALKELKELYSDI